MHTCPKRSTLAHICYNVTYALYRSSFLDVPIWSNPWPVPWLMKLQTQISLNLSDFFYGMMDSPEFGQLVDNFRLHEGCSKKSPIVFEQFRNDFCPSRDNVTECAIYNPILLDDWQHLKTTMPHHIVFWL